MDKSEERWPRRGEGFPAHNVWYEGADKFVALLSANRMMWTRDMGLKYLNVRIDTRSGHFVLSVDGDERVEIERVLKALADANDRFGSETERTPGICLPERLRGYVCNLHDTAGRDKALMDAASEIETMRTEIQALSDDEWQMARKIVAAVMAKNRTPAVTSENAKTPERGLPNQDMPQGGVPQGVIR